MELDNLLEIFIKRGQIKIFVKALKDMFDMGLKKDEMMFMPKIINRIFDKCIEVYDIDSLLRLDEFILQIVNYNVENKTCLCNEIKWLSNWCSCYNVNIINITNGKLSLKKCEEIQVNKMNNNVSFYADIFQYNEIFNGKIVEKLPFDGDRDLELPSRLFSSIQWQNFIKDNDDIIMNKTMVCCLPYHDGQRRICKHSYIKHKNTIYFPILDISKRNIYIDFIDDDIIEIYKEEAIHTYGIIHFKDKTG